MGPGSTSHKTTILVIKTYISFSFEAGDGREFLRGCGPGVRRVDKTLLQFVQVGDL